MENNITTLNTCTIGTLPIEEKTGYTILAVTEMMTTGKGTKFAAVKRKFDDKGTSGVAMMCYGNPAFLTGTNMDMVDVMVTVGAIKPDILTQAIGRVFRPRAGRDNTKPMVMVRIMV